MRTHPTVVDGSGGRHSGRPGVDAVVTAVATFCYRGDRGTAVLKAAVEAESPA